MEEGHLIICALTFVIHLIGTLAYSVRIAGTRTRRIALSLSLFNVLILVSRTSNSFQAPLLAKRVEQNIAAGVTTIRVLAANVDMPRQHWNRIETGGALEPRLVPIALITGIETQRRPGQRPQASGDSLIIVRTADEARRRVGEYAAAGYRQVKMYNELPPSLVPVASGTRVIHRSPAAPRPASAR